jgi:hypothetical protein
LKGIVMPKTEEPMVIDITSASLPRQQGDHLTIRRADAQAQGLEEGRDYRIVSPPPPPESAPESATPPESAPQSAPGSAPSPGGPAPIAGAAPGVVTDRAIKQPRRTRRPRSQ